MRLLEEIRRGEAGYTGGISLVRRYVRQVRRPRGRIYQAVDWQPGEALQVDWGECGRIRLGNTSRRVNVFVAVLCYSRLCYIEFSLAQRKADFYRALVHALEFLGGSPRKLIFDNLKAAVLNGPAGRPVCTRSFWRSAATTIWRRSLVHGGIQNRKAWSRRVSAM